MDPHRIRHGVVLATDFVFRLVPITLTTPKPLVRVHGTWIIDILLDAIVAEEIEEIYIALDHLSEQFDQLLHKYLMVKFV